MNDEEKRKALDRLLLPVMRYSTHDKEVARGGLTSAFGERLLLTSLSV